MKKLMMAAFVAVLGIASANAGDFFWSTWYSGKAQNADVRGCVLGLCSEVKSIAGAQVDLFTSKAEKVNSGAQVAFGYCRTKTLKRGCQVAFWNKAESSALQLGLINFNKTGFLPFFVFFNFDAKQFGGQAK